MRKKGNWALIQAGGIAWVTTISTSWASAPTSATPTIGIVLEVSKDGNGQASLLSGNTQSALTKGVRLHERDLIATGEGANVEVQLDSGSKINIAPKSELEFTQISANAGADVLLKRGLTHYSVIPQGAIRKFHVRTTSAVMGVRGTEFVVEHQDLEGTTLHTLEGAVELGKTREAIESGKEAVLVRGGSQSSLRPGEQVPATPQKFNLRSFLRHLSESSHGFGDKVERAYEDRSKTKNAEGAEKKHVRKGSRAASFKRRHLTPAHPEK